MNKYKLIKPFRLALVRVASAVNYMRRRRQVLLAYLKLDYVHGFVCALSEMGGIIGCTEARVTQGCVIQACVTGWCE